MPRLKISPNEPTVRVNVAVPESVRRQLARLGGSGTAAISRGLRRLVSMRLVVKDGDDAVVLKMTEYVALLTELEALRSGRR